jgi:hypothetical protein
MTPSEMKQRLKAVEKAVSRAPGGADEFIEVLIYNDPEASRLSPHDGEYRMPSNVQPTAEEYRAYQLAERERIKREEQRPPTRLRLKRVPSENGD